MLDLKYTFKNKNLTEHNDHVLVGSPHLIEGFSYKFLITPKSAYWRFGLRLSKSEEIEFVYSGDRHLQGDSREFRDIHISIGDKVGPTWKNPNTFHLAQYNFPKTHVNDHLLSSESSYKSLSPVEFRISHDSERKLLNVGYNAEGTSSWSTSIPIEGYCFFKIFAWADETEFELDCSIQISSIDKTKSEENTLTPFKVGKITFRIGDMFDAYMRKKGNLILLPASSNGTATNNILKRAEELGIPSPSPNSPGSIWLHKPKNTSKILKAGYAFSVDDKTSNSRVIQTLVETIYQNLHELSSKEKQLYIVNLPLLGTGAGAVSPTEVALIFDEILNKGNNSIEYFVSIPSENIYKTIKERMLGKYVPLKNEALQKPKLILELEHDLQTTIDHTAYQVSESNKLIFLALNYITSSDISFLNQFNYLENLSLMGCKINDLSAIEKLSNLQTLVLISTPSSNYSFLSGLKKLTLLQISQASLTELSFLSGLIQLVSLELSENQIGHLTVLGELKALNYLDLTNNYISNISSLSSLTNLDHLLLSGNRISDLETLKKFSKLIYLDISYNNVFDISAVTALPTLQFLKADNNPFLERRDLILADNENHLTPIKSLLERQAESNTQELILPVKILLLGNHASGKSSLLHYLLENNLTVATKSTHIIKIEGYPKNYTQLPKAIFFDFGGQDYYHGVYRAFLTAGSIYLILWNKENNKNQKRIDSNEVFTQDFTLHYWLCQKNYNEQEKYGGEIDPVLLIQTYSDIDKRHSFSDLNEIQEIDNEFYVSLAANSLPAVNGFQIVNERALKYLEATLLELIHKKSNKSQEPKWYVDFLNFILAENSSCNHECKSIISDILPKYNRSGSNKEMYLRNDLDQLHKRGLILYYKESGLQDVVWLNPVKLVNYIHGEILTKERNSAFNGRIPVDKFDGVSPQIIQLLRLQKVIFKHEHGENGEAEFIVPNFLPLSEEDPDYDLITFGVSIPTFILKFKHFLPFGLINQIICHFGDLPEKKKFWRDRLLFTFTNAKILLHIDFQSLEIKVSCSFSKNHSEIDINDIKSYLFYSIMSLYWDFKEILPYDTFLPYFKSGLKIEEISPEHINYEKYQNCKGLYEKEECHPTDLFISVDDLNYISYVDLCAEESSVMISSKSINAARELENSPKVIPIYQFQPFTKRPLKRAKKVAISYSTKDLDLVHKFRDYLVSLYDDDLIENPFQCTQLVAGVEWDEEIQRKFSEADIIFFMISENLMATKYVKEVEIKNAIDRRLKDKSFKIIPIILVHCQWQRKGKYNLGQFTALPFKAQPVTAFKDQHEAWFLTIELIKIMIERELTPDNAEVVLSGEVKRIQEEYFTKR